MHIVANDTLVESPLVVQHIIDSITAQRYHRPKRIWKDRHGRRDTAGDPREGSGSTAGV
ncbi:hypothetical protein [Rhodobacter calidifons]|uniref:hypothetical protein n=1 Tax=Rhodobacter calidifons TaxID=2715277 RepID=UPI001F60F6D3|nr:hypothetical protein [Rhodobacter calidifons]